MRGNLIEAPAVEGADEYGEEDGVDDVLALNLFVGEAARRAVAATGRKRRLKVCVSFSEWSIPLFELLEDCRGRWGGGAAAAIEGRSSRLGGPSSLRAFVAEAAPRVRFCQGSAAPRRERGQACPCVRTWLGACVAGGFSRLGQHVREFMKRRPCDD